MKLVITFGIGLLVGALCTYSWASSRPKEKEIVEVVREVPAPPIETRAIPQTSPETKAQSQPSPVIPQPPVDTIVANKEQPALADGADQNDLVLDFLDNPSEFADRELTARIRFGDRATYRSYVPGYGLNNVGRAGWNKDKDGNFLIPFHGSARKGGSAKIDMTIAIPANMVVPNVAPGDEVLVKFKCGSSSQYGNVAIKIVRPK